MPPSEDPPTETPAPQGQKPHRGGSRFLRALGPPWLAENLEQGLPFLIGGGLCVGLGIWFALHSTLGVTARPPLWLLLAAVGATLGGGGFALSVVEEPTAETGFDGTGEYVLLPRSEYQRWLRGESPARPPKPVVAPEWDESAGLPQGASADRDSVERAAEELLAASRSLSPPAAAEAEAGPVAPTHTAPWEEEPIRELESVLDEIQREAAPAPPPPVPRTPPSRCAGCGDVVAAYREQSCIVCDRPLCDRCLEKSVAEGRPSTCPSCQLPRDVSESI